MTSDYTRPAGSLDDPIEPAVSTAGLSGASASTPTSASAGTTGTSTTGTSTTGTNGDAADGIKDRAKAAAGTASDAGGQLLEHAKEDASGVTDEARRQVGELWVQARDEVSEQVGTQQQRLAGGLRTFGSDLDQMASASTEQGVAAQLVRELGSRAGDVSRWLEDRGPDDLLVEVRSFARRRPGTFLLVAAGAGLLAGRLARALKDAPQNDASTTASNGTSTTYASTGTSGFAPSGATPAFEVPASSVPSSAPAPSVGTTREAASVGSSGIYDEGGRP